MPCPARFAADRRHATLAGLVIPAFRYPILEDLMNCGESHCLRGIRRFVTDRSHHLSRDVKRKGKAPPEFLQEGLPFLHTGFPKPVSTPMFLFPLAILFASAILKRPESDGAIINLGDCPGLCVRCNCLGQLCHAWPNRSWT